MLLVHKVGVGAVDGHLVPAEFLLGFFARGLRQLLDLVDRIVGHAGESAQYFQRSPGVILLIRILINRFVIGGFAKLAYFCLRLEQRFELQHELTALVRG